MGPINYTFQKNSGLSVTFFSPTTIQVVRCLLTLREDLSSLMVSTVTTTHSTLLYFYKTEKIAWRLIPSSFHLHGIMIVTVNFMCQLIGTWVPELNIISGSVCEDVSDKKSPLSKFIVYPSWSSKIPQNPSQGTLLTRSSTCWPAAVALLSYTYIPLAEPVLPHLNHAKIWPSLWVWWSEYSRKCYLREEASSFKISNTFDVPL